MKKQALVLLFIMVAGLFFIIPTVSAEHSPPPNLSVYVYGPTLPFAILNFTFTMSTEDTSGAPTFQYNLSRGVFFPTDEGDVSTFDNYTVNGRIISFSYTDTIGNYDFFQIASNDGNDTQLSCYVSVYTNVIGDSDACNEDGISALVVDENPAPGSDTIDVRFPFNPLDDGTWNYTLWVASPEGDFSLGNTAFLPDYLEGDGLASFKVSFGGDDVDLTLYIVASNATVEQQTCRITLNTGTLNDFDACGRMVTLWQELHCLPTVPTETLSGFNYRKHVDVEGTGNATYYQFSRLPGANDAQSLAAINLPGDTRSYRFHFNMEADVDVVDSNFNLFFSTVPGAVSAANAPPDGPARPTTGAFTDGYGLQLNEDPNGYDAAIYRNVGGQQTILAIENWDAGIDPNSPEDGIFTVDPWQGIITASMGSESMLVDLDDDAPQLGSTHSMWLRENGGTTTFIASTFLGVGAPPTNCFHTAYVQQFGGVEEVSTGVELNDLPRFGGQGGYLTSPPTFPGMNVSNQATSMGLTAEQLGYVLAGIIAFMVAFGAAAFLGPVGGGFGFFASVALSAVLGLIPAWFMIVGFMALATGVVLQVKGGN